MKVYSRIENNFIEHINKKRLTGIACGIYQGEEEIYRGFFGYHDCAQTKPLNENAIFRLASMTKPVTATAILIAEERGWLKLDDPVGKYIKGFRHDGVGRMCDGVIEYVQNAREITIRDCLTHSSGLGSGCVGNYQFAQKSAPSTLKENVFGWNGLLLDFAPGTEQGYSALVAFELLAYIVEIVSGIPFEMFLQTEIFDPLGMKDTGYRLTDENKHRLVEMSRTTNDGGLECVDFGWKGFETFVEGYTGGSAGLFSTLDDYSKFVRMLASNGCFLGKRILSQASVKKMRTAQLGLDIPGISVYFNWGLGVRVCEMQGENQPLSDGSFGWSGAYGTHFWVEPKTGRSAVLMLNKADVGGSGSPYSYEFEKLVQGIFDNKFTI